MDKVAFIVVDGSNVTRAWARGPKSDPEEVQDYALELYVAWIQKSYGNVMVKPVKILSTTSLGEPAEVVGTVFTDKKTGKLFIDRSRRAPIEWE